MDDCGKLSFFDVNAYLGRRGQYRGRFFWKKSDLVNAMDNSGVDKALVCHTLTKELHPLEGNAEVVKTLEGQSRLLPSWGVLPTMGLRNSPEMPLLDDFIGKMKDNDVRVVRVFPDNSAHRFSLSEWSMGDIYHRLGESRIPVIIDYALNTYKQGPIDWDEVYKICSNHPRLPVILTGVGYRSCRQLVPVFRACSNLRIELSRFMVHRGVEFICREFDAGRLLFGSKLPFQNPGPIMAMVLYARISYEEKILIAGLNLKKLLNGIRW